MNIPLPCSTLALAIGWFECCQTSTVALSSTIPCRVLSAKSVLHEASEELLPRCTKYVTAACELLGPYPFTRMDLVILPRCFACMGLMRCVFLKTRRMFSIFSRSIDLNTCGYHCFSLFYYLSLTSYSTKTKN